MKTLHYNNANTKEKLFALYLNQFSETEIRIYINDIINKRGKHKRNISVKELLTFTELYGLPLNYKLSDELEQAKLFLKLKV